MSQCKADMLIKMTRDTKHFKISITQLSTNLFCLMYISIFRYNFESRVQLLLLYLVNHKYIIFLFGLPNCNPYHVRLLVFYSIIINH